VALATLQLLNKPACVAFVSLDCVHANNPQPHAGTMLFGESTDEQFAHDLLNHAAEAGINFFDSAEMYPVPPRSETQGLSEAILGRWMRTRSRQGSTSL
jgi:predicted aldo/keto reductase-like oxidoreductase